MFRRVYTRTVVFTKDFDGWNNRKKKLDATVARRYYHPREIWWCALGVNVGFEQDGTGTGYQRPVLILQGLSLETCLVVPLTTSKKPSKYRASVGTVGGKSAQAILSQIRVVDTKRLVNRIDILDQATFAVIRKSAIAML